LKKDSFFGIVTIEKTTRYNPRKGIHAMKADVIIDQETQKVKLIFDWAAGKIGEHLTADEAENVVKLIEAASQNANREAFKAWLMQHECHDDVTVVDGKTYRFKMVSEKKFLTKFGVIIVPRRIFQQDNGGKTYVPLDVAWEMSGEYATRDVRECVLYMSASMSPNETEECLQKIAAFHPSRTAIQNIIDETGQLLEQHEDVLLDEVRLHEELLIKETKVFAVSLDGVNVRLNTPGKKKGRPTERPKDEASMSRETPSCFKNAMVGVCGLYGEVPQNTDSNASTNTSTPKRLYGNCLARMPEDHAMTFKRKIETEVNSMLVRLPEGTVKIVLMDGGRNLWGYVNATKLYDDFEKLLDFHHAMEHISQGAEGIFGKGTEASKAWYRKMEAMLLEYEDGVHRVIRSLEYYLARYEYKESSRELMTSCLTFLQNNAHIMEYKRFRDNGWPIGSGPVEGACKNIVKQRLCRSGMRWSIPGGQTILTLRSIVKSNRWNEFWNACKKLPGLSKPA
jgi:hypothetical protein